MKLATAMIFLILPTLSYSHEKISCLSADFFQIKKIRTLTKNENVNGCIFTKFTSHPDLGYPPLLLIVMRKKPNLRLGPYHTQTTTFKFIGFNNIDYGNAPKESSFLSQKEISRKQITSIKNEKFKSRSDQITIETLYLSSENKTNRQKKIINHHFYQPYRKKRILYLCIRKHRIQRYINQLRKWLCFDIPKN